MNCETAHEQIALQVYGEQADEQVHALNRHLNACPECRRELDEAQALKLLADAYAAPDPDANLVARSRLRLEEALNAMPPRRWYERLALQLRNNFAGLQSAPVAAALMLVIGAGAGTMGGYYYANLHSAGAAGTKQAQMQLVAANTASAPDPQGAQFANASFASAAQGQVPPAAAQVASISNISRDPLSGQVVVSFNQIVPRQISGPPSDPAVRQLLVLASQSSDSPGVRDNSIGLLADECQHTNGCQGILDTLMIALAGDQDLNVRLKALDGLQPFVTTNEVVRNAVLQAVLADPEPRLRSHAIAILVPAGSDSNVRQVLTTVANSDRNILIRTASRNVLNQMSEVQ
jgi:anti-sigma factor RsiW